VLVSTSCCITSASLQAFDEAAFGASVLQVCVRRLALCSTVFLWILRYCCVVSPALWCRCLKRFCSLQAFDEAALLKACTAAEGPGGSRALKEKLEAVRARKAWVMEAMALKRVARMRSSAGKTAANPFHVPPFT
jgi:hypothetical protein